MSAVKLIKLIDVRALNGRKEASNGTSGLYENGPSRISFFEKSPLKKFVYSSYCSTSNGLSPTNELSKPSFPQLNRGIERSNRHMMSRMKCNVFNQVL